MAHLTVLSVAVLCAVMFAGGFYASAFFPRRASAVTERAHACSWEFVRYMPSPLEERWVSNAAAWGERPCPHMEKEWALFASWVPQVQAYEKASANELPAMSRDVFSVFEYRESCTGRTVEIPIEPFAGIGRHPETCRDSSYVLSKEYLLTQRRTLPPHRRALFFDLGASLWNSGGGGASQSWLYDVYRRRGLQFDDIYAWEVTKMDPVEVFAQIPGEVRAAYDWFNIPADPQVGAAGNPLTILLQVARPEDFVVVKIDIDNSPVELQFINQIMENASLSSLIDELYFEHHFNMHPMIELGWVASGSESGMTMVDSARIFTGMRNRGIRAHVWL
jgi:hypothetical protein